MRFLSSVLLAGGSILLAASTAAAQQPTADQPSDVGRILRPNAQAWPGFDLSWRREDEITGALRSSIQAALESEALGTCLALADARSVPFEMTLGLGAADAELVWRRPVVDALARYCIEAHFFAPGAFRTAGAERSRVTVRGTLATTTASTRAVISELRVTRADDGGLGLDRRTTSDPWRLPFELRRERELAFFEDRVLSYRAPDDSATTLTVATEALAVVGRIDAMERVALFALHPCARLSRHARAELALRTETQPTEPFVTVAAEPIAQSDEPAVLACVSERTPALARYLRALLPAQPVRVMHTIAIAVRRPERHELPAQVSTGGLGRRGP